MDRPPIDPRDAAALADLLSLCAADSPLIRAYDQAQTWHDQAAHIIKTAAATGTGASHVGAYRHALDQERHAMRGFLRAAPRTPNQAFFKTAVLLLDHAAGVPWYFDEPGERFDLIREQIKIGGGRLKR